VESRSSSSLLLIDSRCSEIASFKTEVLDKMSEESTVSQFATIFSLREKNQYSFFVAGINGVAEFPCGIIWDAALLMLSEAHGSSS
jgi:hypothetical protein